MTTPLHLSPGDPFNQRLGIQGDQPTPPQPPAPMVLHTRVVTGRGGGPDKTIFRSTDYADPAHLQMACAYIHPHDDLGIAALRKQAQQHQCTLWTIGESGPADPGTVRRLLQLCRHLNVCIWHGHDYKSNLYGLLLRRWWPMKLVTTVHGWTRHTARTRLYYHIDNWCLRHYDHVITVNPLLTEHCRSRGVPPDRLTHVPNAIEMDHYIPADSTTAARRRMGIEQDRLIIGIVGRLSAEKGVDRAIRMLVELRTTFPNVQLHLVGDGPERNRLSALAGELGVDNRVRFWGWQNKTQQLYSAMDVLLLPSHTEGLPNVVLEAMAMGVCVAATDVGGVSDLLDHGRCGLILSHDPRSWAHRLAYLLASTDRRRTIANLARARVQSHYTFARRMERILGVYGQMIGHRLGAIRPTGSLKQAA